METLAATTEPDQTGVQSAKVEPKSEPNRQKVESPV